MATRTEVCRVLMHRTIKNERFIVDVFRGSKGPSIASRDNTWDPRLRRMQPPVCALHASDHDGIRESKEPRNRGSIEPYCCSGSALARVAYSVTQAHTPIAAFLSL